MTPLLSSRVTETRGSTPRKANSKMIVDASGKPWGTIGELN